MVDFTKVQTFDIPPDIKILKKTIANLAGENKILKNTLYTVGIGTAFFLVYILFINNKPIYVQPNHTKPEDQHDQG